MRRENKMTNRKLRESDIIAEPEMSYVEEEDVDSTVELPAKLEQPAPGEDLADKVEQAVASVQSGKPSDEYNPAEDPEYESSTGEIGLNESGLLWKGYMKNPKTLRENIVTDMVRFISNDCNGDTDLVNMDSFFAAYPQGEGTMKYNRSHPEVFAQTVQKAAAKLGVSAKIGDVATPGAAAPKPVVPAEIDRSKLSADALAMLEETEAMEEDSLDETASLADIVESKYDNLYLAAANILSGRSMKKFALLYGDAGIGKSYSVNKAIKEVWPKSKLKSKGWRLTKTKGAIGNAITNIVVYFFSHRNNEVIILDDADGFLLSKDQNVQNLLKGMLDTDNTPTNPQAVSIPSTIAAKATKMLAARNKEGRDPLEEGIRIHIDQQLLREGILSVSVNDEEVVQTRITEADAAKFALPRLREEEDFVHAVRNPMGGIRNIFREATAEEEEFAPEDEDEEFITGEDDEDLMVDTEETEVPTDWVFSSRMILISNLTKDQLNDAVASRCDTVGIHLEPDEFCCKLMKILPDMMKDLSATELDPAIVDYAKNSAYGLFNNVIELAEQGVAPYGVPVHINPKALQFRIIPELTGGWIRTADAFVAKWNRQHPEQALDAIPETMPIIAQNIKKTYVKTVLLPTLSAGLKSAEATTKKKSYIG